MKREKTSNITKVVLALGNSDTLLEKEFNSTGKVGMIKTSYSQPFLEQNSWKIGGF